MSLTEQQQRENQKRMEKIAAQKFSEFRPLFTNYTNGIGTYAEETGIIEGADFRNKVCFTTYNLPGEDTLLLVNGNDEVKASTGILRKTGDYNHFERSGTIPIEIIGAWSKKPEKRNNYYAGWILSLFNPEKLNQIKKDHNRPETAEQPGTLAFFLFDGEEGSEQPFACVAFEFMELLKQRIKECLPAEWDIENFSLPNQGTTKESIEFWSRYIDFDNHGFCANWDPDRGGMIQNCWHIPLRKLADIATVTMIGETDPYIRHWDALQDALQRDRLQFIKDYAWAFVERNGIIEAHERRVVEKWERIYKRRVLDMEEKTGQHMQRIKYGSVLPIDIRDYLRAQWKCKNYPKQWSK